MRDTPASSGLPDDHDPDAAPVTRRRNVADARSGARHLAAPGAGPSIGAPDDAVLADRESDGPAGHGIGRTTLEWLGVIAFGVLIALTARLFLVEVFWIPSESMVPTLQEGDRVLVNKLSYKAHDVHRGDVIVFERPPAAVHPGQDDEIKDLIKRVVAVGGDTIEARDGSVYVNGERIEEPYLVEGTPTDGLPLTEVPEGHVFVMGDNRTNSEDSRRFGPIDEDTIVGRAIIKVLPPSDISWL